MIRAIRMSVADVFSQWPVTMTPFSSCVSSMAVNSDPSAPRSINIVVGRTTEPAKYGSVGFFDPRRSSRRAPRDANTASARSVHVFGVSSSSSLICMLPLSTCAEMSTPFRNTHTRRLTPPPRTAPPRHCAPPTAYRCAFWFAETQWRVSGNANRTAIGSVLQRYTASCSMVFAQV
jgi:hypothetical protein